MSTITLPNIRVGSDLQVRVRLKDGGVAIDWSTLSNIKACIYSDAQRALAGRCAFSIDEEDNTLLVCTYAANKPQYLGVNRIVISAKYMGETKTYDKPAFSFVRWTADQEGEEITIDDPDVDVEITVEDVSSSILQEAVDAAFSAADRANEAAAAAEHMVDIHTGPEGKSAYEVAVDEGYTGTEEEWLASLKGDTGETPDISIGTVTTVEPGTPAAASMTGTPEAPVLNLSIPKGLVGATPNFTVGTVTTGEPGSSVIVTITGTPEAPVLNLTIPQGMQGNTGSSVDYPYELVNNLTTNDATKGLSAAQGVVLAGQVSQLEHQVGDSVPNPQRQNFPADSWTSGKFIYSNTGLEGDVSSDVSDSNAIDVSAAAGKTLHYFRIALTNASGTIGMAFYDSNNAYISGEPGLYGHSSTTMVDGEILVPSNAKYARFSCLTAQKDNFYAYVEIPGFIFLNGIGKQVQDLEEGVGGLSVMKVKSTNADFKLTDEDGYTILELDGGNIKTKNFDSDGMPSVESTSMDFDISDGNGKSVLKLKDGGIKTKNFDSEELPGIDESLADYEISDDSGNVLVRFRRGHIRTKNFDSESVEDSPLYGKKIVWYGTSIPAAGYPQVVGDYLGAIVYNEAVGSSSCRMGYSTAVVPGDLGDPYGITGMSWNVPGLSLSMKQEEKYDICLNWTTERRQANLIAKGYTAEQVANVRGWGELLTGNPPADIMTSDNDVYRKLWYGCSYNTPASPVEPSLGVIEGKVDKYLNAESFPDLWVFDHGHNDAQNSELMKTIPTPDDDRTYFIGAMNYIIKHILSYNPRARFVFIGHYENDDAFGWNHSILCQSQEVLANYWDAPLYKAWEMYGLSRNVVITTNAYWDTDGVWHESGFDGTNGYTGYHYDGVPENIRQVDGVWVHDMSLIWVHMLDGLHPFQEKIKDFIGHSIARYFYSLIVNF